MRPRTSSQLFVVLAIAAIVAACQGAASPTASPPATLPALGSPRPTTQPLGLPTPSRALPTLPGQTGGAQPTGAATQPPLTTPRPSGNATSGPVGSGVVTPFHGATDLERVIPTQAGGLPLTVESVAGATFQDSHGTHKIGLRCRWYADRGLRCRDQKQLVAALGALGHSPQDAAIAVGYNETKAKEIEVQATRVAGVSGAQLRDAVLSVLSAAAAARKQPLNVAAGTVGGKSVTVITYRTPYPLGLRRWLYASGDVLYDIRRAYDAPAAEILQGLP